MFSYLSRGYGTWEGIAKLEKPESAISPNPGNYDILPPIRRDQYQFYDQHFNRGRPYTLQEDFKLPQVQKDAVHLPKTYSTKSGALLLYSEGCFRPGSRRLKKRQRHRRQKIEQRIRTMKDLMDLIMDYKKNGCDPLLLEQLWRHMSGNARDVQPGYSPKRYLGHLSHTFDPEQWKRLVETGSLKSFGTADDGYLSFLPEYDHHLNRQPPPYKTMSLPPVSPSSSMLGSFTFYKHALSTGAASMVSLPSMGSENIDSINADHISVKSAATFAESLAERLAEVESENGFKKDYETLTAKEKEDILTQLLMDVTLHNQGEVITVPIHTTEMIEDPASDSTDISYISETKPSKSLESLQSSNSVQTPLSEDTRSRTRRIKSSTSMNSSRTAQMQMSDKSSKSSKSGRRSKSSKSDIRSKSPSRSRSVCSLPPIIVPRTTTPDQDDMKDISNDASLSSSHSGLGLVVADFEVGLNDVDIEIKDDLFNLEDTGFHPEEKDLETRSMKSNEGFSEHSLVDALSIQDGDSLHQFTDETKSLKSLASTYGSMHQTERMDESLSSDGAIGGSKTADVDLVNGIVDDAIGDSYHVPNDGSRYSEDIADGTGYDIESDGDDDGITIVVDAGDDGTRNSDGCSVNEGDGPSICVTEVRSPDAGGHPEATLPTIDLAPPPELQAPHISLGSLQDEVRLVATEVLSRPKSGRMLTEDAEMATFLLVERMQGLLGPALTENTRVSSAAPKKVRPLGQPRKSEAKGKRRVRSAEPILASRNIIGSEEKQVEPVPPVPKTEETPVEQVSSEEQESSVEVDPVSETDRKDLSVDDVIVTVETVKDTQPVERNEPQSPAPATPSPERTPLMVEDLKPEVKQEVITKLEEVKAKEKTVKKLGGKVKKTVNGKRVAKGQKKRPSNARARNEPPKTPPFHAGLVPESKPPKGLAGKAGGTRKKGKQVSPDLQEKTQPKTTDKVPEIDDQSPETSVRVDSETGEVEHGISPTRSEKSPSLAGSNSSSGGRKSGSRQDQVSRAQTGSSRSQIDSPREKSPQEKMSSSRDKTPSPREKLPSPSGQKACPRDRDAVFNETTNVNREHAITEVVTEPEPSPTREPSPEVVLTEKQRRANARAAQRAAAAERRRQEVERKRREREEARKRAQEEEARLDILRKESEEEMKKREEERRTQKEQEERERMRLEAEQNERARQERLMNERQRQAREEWKRKKEQLVAQRKFEEELRKERERVELEIEEERRREYADKIAHLEEEEQQRLMEERRLQEERIKREIQEEKERREEERLRMLEERRLMEEELAAARMRQMERRSFLETLLQDFQNLLLDQRITRAFTFSYFDIMPWFKDRWRDLEDDRPRSKRPSTRLDTVPEESEIDLEQAF